MRAISIKHAERWLERIKELNPSIYRDLGKCLKKFDQSSDQLQCFLKMNEVLYNIPNLAEELNCFMEEGNKFIVNKSLQQRLNSFLDIVRDTKQQLFKEITQFINKLAKEDRKILQLSNDEAIKIVKDGIVNIVKLYPKLLLEAQKIIPPSLEQGIKKLDLKHLKNKVIAASIVKQQNQEAFTLKKQKKHNLVEVAGEKVKDYYRSKMIAPPNFLTSSEQKNFIKQLEKKLKPYIYQQFLKILELYHKNIITRHEIIKLVQPVLGYDIYGFKEIIATRQFDRRKASMFKPLCDTDFHFLPRETHSYVQMPGSYPHFSANRTKESLAILNNKWVSVPRGSQVTFNIRIKNPYELALNKCEDERYQFDLLRMRCKKVIQIFNKIILETQKQQQVQVNFLINKVISIGLIQLLYKNASKEQRQSLEEELAKNTLNCIIVFKERVSKMLQDLQEYKKTYAQKSWIEVGHKNFYKSLDFKNHDFKNNQKTKMKAQTFLDELNFNIQYLQSRGTKRIIHNPFEEKKDFFSILNSFQISSKKERCLFRSLPKLPHYDMAMHKFPIFLPALIMSFEDRKALSLTCTYVYFYIEHGITNDGEKMRCRSLLKDIMCRFFKIQQLSIQCLKNDFEQDSFFQKLLGDQKFSPLVISNFIQKKIENLNTLQINEQNDIPYCNFFQDTVTQFCFQPPKDHTNVVYYSSQNFYVFLRFFYCLYERVIKMGELTKDESTLKLFQVLYFACIKMKQNPKYQDCLSILFKDFSYLFSTFYKITEGVSKSLNAVTLNPLQSYSLSMMGTSKEEAYLLLMNRYILNTQINVSRLIRSTYDFERCIMYINSFNPFYKINEQNLKQCNKKRVEISKSVEQFSIGMVDNPIAFVKEANTITINRQEYYFDSNSNRLANIPYCEDIILQNKQKVDRKNEKQIQIAKVKKVMMRYK